jgi:hypothetical protein
VHCSARHALTAKNRINNIAFPASRLLKSKVRAGSPRHCAAQYRDGRSVKIGLLDSPAERPSGVSPAVSFDDVDREMRGR